MCRKITSHWQPLFSKKIVGQRPHFPTKLAAAVSFFNKIGGGSKDLATLLAAVLAWSGYWKHRVNTIQKRLTQYECQQPVA